MRTPLKTAVSVLFYIDAFIWFIGVIPTLYLSGVSKSLFCRWGSTSENLPSRRLSE